MNTYRIKMATISLSFFSILVMLWLNKQTEDSNFMGSFILNLPGVKLERIITAVDLKEILTEQSNYDVNKIKVKSYFDLHELDPDLIAAIKGLDYSDDFSVSLRKMQQHTQGPFASPEVPVELAFNDQIDIDRAQVCADSMFLNRSLTIATEDLNSIDMIENANEILLLECPAKDREIERIVVAEKFGARLLGTKKTPPSLLAIAKPIQNIRFIHSPNKESVK